MSVPQLTTLTFCLTVERADGAGLAVTSHDGVLERDGTRYLPSPGVTPSSVIRTSELGGTETEIEGSIDNAALSIRDLSSGRWDGARTSLDALNWHDTHGEVTRLIDGALSGTNVSGNRFTAELRGSEDRLLRAPCPVIAPECRAALGDKHCRVDMAGRGLTVTVVRVDGELVEVDAGVSDRFVFGNARWMTGENTGLHGVVLQCNGNELVLRERPRLPVQSGDRLRISEGCDKRLVTCAERFANAVNFRGEPHVPGNDLLTRYPGG